MKPTKDMKRTVLLRSFEVNLQEQLTGTPVLVRRAKRILDILNSPPSPRRTRRIARMERHAAAAIDATGKIDWSKVDWAKFLETILAVLLKLLPFILAV